MKHTVSKTICLLFSIFLYTVTSAQGITGTWNGSLHVQPRDIPIVFHIGRDSSGKLIATFDSPSQNAFNLPVSEVITKGDSVILMIGVLNGKYAGIVGGEKNVIGGQWYQSGGSLPLTMTRTSGTATVKQQLRPQTPKPPFPYQTRDVEYWNADKSIRYGATLTYPYTDPAGPGKKSFPAVILITGSGQQDRDEMLYGHKPFAVIADNLTRKGFLVLRVDDRGIGKTTGDFSKATSLDFAKDVEAGLDFLEAQPEVNKEKIGLIGHSEGGMIAPMVADERKDVKFMILLAAPGIPIIDLMQQQAEAVSLTQGRTPAEAKAGARFVRIVMEEVNKNQDTATTVQNVRMRVGAWIRTVDTITLAKIKSRDTTSTDEKIRQTVEGMGSEWFRYFIAFDPQPYLQKLHCKVLALNGSKDVQVIASSNLAGIRATLQKSHSPAYDVIELPGLNHLFQTCIKCSPAEYVDLQETFSPGALERIDDWLLKNVQ
jgi:pimeloyl-ACP methyl ester carboxylesterase